MRSACPGNWQGRARPACSIRQTLRSHAEPAGAMTAATQTVALVSGIDLDEFRDACRALIARGAAPATVTWVSADAVDGELFGEEANEDAPDAPHAPAQLEAGSASDRKSTRLNSSHMSIS